MRLNKDGTPDKRFKENKEETRNEAVIFTDDPDSIDFSKVSMDPNELLNQFLEENDIELDFDVVEGTLPTKFGIIKLDKPTLTLKASYVKS